MNASELGREEIRAVVPLTAPVALWCFAVFAVLVFEVAGETAAAGADVVVVALVVVPSTVGVVDAVVVPATDAVLFDVVVVTGVD